MMHVTTAASPASSPLRSGSGTPSKLSGFFDSLRWPRPESPGFLSTAGGGDPIFMSASASNTQRVGLPSLSNGLAKRERIRKLEEELSASHALLTRQAAELSSEVAARTDVQERLNMQHFKSSLVVDMLVAKLLQLDNAPLLRPGGTAVTSMHPTG